MGWSRCKCLSGASDNLAILDETLDHPVTLAATQNAVINAALAQIVVTVITGAAMVVLVRYWPVTIVAVNRV